MRVKTKNGANSLESTSTDSSRGGTMNQRSTRRLIARLLIIMLSFCVLFLSSCGEIVGASEPVEPKEIKTEPGAFKDAAAHVQGICCDENAIYVVFSNYIYKLDWSGKTLRSVPAVSHSGDPCLAMGKLYVSMSSEDACAVYEYDLELNLLRKIKIPECPACDGIAFLDGRFYTGGPSPSTPHEDNPLNIFDERFKRLSHHEISFGAKTNYGPQSIASCRGVLLIAFYAVDKTQGAPRGAIVNSDGGVLGVTELDGSNGWYALPESMQPNPKEFTRLLVARTDEKQDGQTSACFRWVDFDGKTLRDVTVK